MIDSVEEWGVSALANAAITGAVMNRSDRLLRLSNFNSVADPVPGADTSSLPRVQVDEESGFYVLPAIELSARERQFLNLAYQDRWVMEGFDWMTWLRSERGRNLTSRKTLIAQATEMELAQVITTLVRQDRFIEGALHEAFQSGLIAAMVDRAKALCM